MFKGFLTARKSKGFLKSTRLTTEEKREKLAQRFYNQTYAECCWRQKDRINNLIEANK